MQPAPRGPVGRAAGRVAPSAGIALLAAILLASPAAASGDVVSEWRDLQGRCEAAVTEAAPLDVSGLEEREPTLIADVVEEPPFGVRIERVPLQTSVRNVPTGIWGVPGGRFEMTLLEFTTRPGTRAICEVAVARGAEGLSPAEADGIAAAFAARRDAMAAGGAFEAETFGAATVGMTSARPNPRGCPVVVSLTVRREGDRFRSSAAERAGVPGCGGPSLAGGLTRLPASLNPRREP